MMFMIAHIVFKDVNPYVYEITDDCHIYKNGEEVNIDDIIYHSTNGYDYVMLEQNHLESEEPKMKLYRLEFIMVSSFNPGLQNKWEWFKVNHLDGDITNCRLDNLTFEEDIEDFICMPDKQDLKRKYMISNHGRIIDCTTHRYVPTHFCNGYSQCVINRNTTKIHRIIAELFVHNPLPSEYTEVNHIDGCKSNNHQSNLEWVSHKMNIIHALRTQLIHTQKISTAELDSIRDMLCDPQYNGEPMKIFNALNKSEHPDISIRTIYAVKANSPFTRRSNKYDITNTHYIRSTHNIPSAHKGMIIKLLLDDKYGGSPQNIYNAIDHNKYPDITVKTISSIKCNNWNKFGFHNSRKQFTSDDVDHIIGLLMDPALKGSPKQVYRAIDKEKYKHITLSTIKNIKARRNNFINLAKKYDLATVQFAN